MFVYKIIFAYSCVTVPTEARKKSYTYVLGLLTEEKKRKGKQKKTVIHDDNSQQERNEV